MTIKDNRSKREMTLYEYADSRPALKIDEEFVKFIDYPTREEFGFVDCDINDYRVAYSSFIKTKGDRVLSDLAEMLAND